MTTRNYLAEIEAIEKSDLSAEEKKKKVRRLKRQIRKHEVKVIEQTAEPSLSGEELWKLCQESFSFPYKEGITRTSGGYGYDLGLAARQGVADPEVFITKFQTLFGYKPKWFDSTHQGNSTILLLGPVTEVK